MMMGSVNGSSQALALSHVTRITHLRLGPVLNNRARRLPRRLAGATPMWHSMNLPSPPIGLLPNEQTTFQAKGSRMVNIQLPNVKAVVALSPDVQPRDGMDGPEDIMSDSEESVEDLLE
ncbi:hypothetical protein ACJRO7_026552 [Eucalyptus globulus]|uniref:Uncharacterized protein n=1 Tax=Eucalyptus globulus TaxID=34317 RepID=A0ABD3JN65_EUCGL